MCLFLTRPFSWALLVLTLPTTLHAESKTIARCGAGFLEEVDGRKVLHLKGTPYEMGYQQGALLKDDIHGLVRFLLDEKAKGLKLDLGPIQAEPKTLIKIISQGQKKFVPQRFYEEMRGVADGSGIDYNEIVVCNFIPELFHCSGFAGSSTTASTGAFKTTPWSPWPSPTARMRS
jgi:hypothetical protein